MLLDEGGSVVPWRIQDPYDNLNTGTWQSPNVVELAWHIYLAGLDSGFNYYGGLGNDDEVKQSLATSRAIEKLSSYVNARLANDHTPPTVLRPQRFPWNPGGYTFGWFNSIPGGNTSYLKKMPSDFYIWTHAYDVSGVQSVNLKVRVSNTGVNSLANNDNETYLGGSSVGQWITIPMTKRVLPNTRTALNAAANNGQIDYFITPPVLADYYFAKITDANVTGFRGKLLDYYIEATDNSINHNPSKSDIQHVFVEDDGNGTPPPAPATPTGLSAVASSSTQIDVSWNASTYATTYLLKRNGVAIATQAGTTFSDTGRAPNTTYTYTVAAQNTTATSADSASVSATTPNGPVNFVMDGIADSEGYLIAKNGMTLYAAVRGTKLYVATWSTGNSGGANDHFIFVSDTVLGSASTTAPWSKAGHIAIPSGKPFLAAESTNSYAGWQNAGSVTTTAAKAASSSGQLEGTIDLVQAFGSMPSSIYLAAVAYQTADAGNIASQCPTGNGNNDLEQNEFLAFPIAALTDANNDGVLDRLDPMLDFKGQISFGTDGFPLISWPCVPGKLFQVEYRDDLSANWSNLVAPLSAGSGQLILSTSDQASQSRRFYRVRSLP